MLRLSSLQSIQLSENPNVLVLLLGVVLLALSGTPGVAQDLVGTNVLLQTETGLKPETAVENPQIGQSLYPTFYFTYSGSGDLPSVAARIRHNGAELCPPYNLENLPPGVQAAVWCVTPWAVAAGQHTFEGTVDPDNAIAESNDNNNTFSRTYNIGGVPPTPTPTPIANPSPSPTPSTGKSMAYELFEFALSWMEISYKASDLLALLNGAIVTFDFQDFFVETAGSNWHYTGANGASQDDDFRWTVESTRQDVGGGKDAARFRTDTDEASDARNGDVDLWRIESNGDVVFYGVIRASDREYHGVTFPAQPIILLQPILVGRDGLKIGDEITDSKSGSMDVIVPYLGTQTLTGTFNSSVKFTDFLPDFVTPLGTFTNVLRVVIDIEATVSVPVVGNVNFTFTNNTFLFKEGVGMIAQDQAPDPDDAQIQAIDEGTVYVGGSPVTVVAN